MAKNYVTSFRGENYYTPNGKMHIKDEPVTPIEEDFGEHNQLDCFDNDYGSSMRKSMSMNDISALQADIVKLEFNDRPDMYQRYRRPTGGPHELSKTKFVSMAEAIYHYQRDTPGRFHSKRPQIFRSQIASEKSGPTVPQSPMLRSKSRSRATHIISQKEKEEMEIEEIKKFKIKAHPIPKSVIEGAHLPEVLKKPITIPEPFNLTEIHKKDTQSPGKIQKFKARPAPKHILEKPQVPFKPPPQVIRSISPKFHYKKSTTENHSKPEMKGALAQKTTDKWQRHGPVKPEPFSFEKRDEVLKQRREARIKQQIEEERKQASQFKAQPLPGAVKKRMQQTTGKTNTSTTSSENKENFTKFEARPPVVLYKEPFKPVLQQVHLIKSAPFDLTTVKRALEREKFDKLLKEKEEEHERIRQQREKEQQEADEHAKAEFRAKLIHHAKPVPAAAPFLPERSLAPLTVPETPKFVRRLNQN